MTRPRLVSTIAGAALALALLPGSLATAQAPAPAPAPPQAPAAPSPTPPAGSGQAAPPAAPAAPAQQSEAFAQDVMLTEKTIVFFAGSATWDNAFETIVDALKTVTGVLKQQGLAASGPAMTIYTSTDDTGFQFQAGFPVAQAPANPPRGDVAVGQSPQGKALKFVHRGSYDAMDSTYEAITNYLDEKNLEAKDLFVEEYETDPITTPEDKLVISVYVPLK